MVGREMSELNAAADPRLINDKRQQMRPTRKSAGMGTWSVGWICNFVLSDDSHSQD